MRGVDLGFSDLTGADLTGADLTGADLDGSNLGVSDLGTKLTEANLRSAKLTGAILTGANLGGADLTGAKLPDNFAEAAVRHRDHRTARGRHAKVMSWRKRPRPNLYREPTIAHGRQRSTTPKQIRTAA
jgi:uncharacterized protein YjbI with pentapeptide repeats